MRCTSARDGEWFTASADMVYPIVTGLVSLLGHHLAQAANQLDPLLEGYDFATLEKGKGSATNANSL